MSTEDDGPEADLLTAKVNFDQAVRYLADPSLSEVVRGELVNEALALCVAGLLGVDERDVLSELGTPVGLPVALDPRAALESVLGAYVVAVNAAVEQQATPDGVDSAEDPDDPDDPAWLRRIGGTYTVRANAIERLEVAQDLMGHMAADAQTPSVAPESVEVCADLLADLVDAQFRRIA